MRLHQDILSLKVTSAELEDNIILYKCFVHSHSLHFGHFGQSLTTETSRICGTNPIVSKAQRNPFHHEGHEVNEERHSSQRIASSGAVIR